MAPGREGSAFARLGSGVLVLSPSTRKGDSEPFFGHLIQIGLYLSSSAPKDHTVISYTSLPSDSGKRDAGKVVESSCTTEGHG